MASKILLADIASATPAQIALKGATYGPTTAADLRAAGSTAGVITLTSLANNAARQSTKFDFGAVRAARYSMRLAAELAATPTAGNVIRAWMGYSAVTTAANGNPAGLGGSDAAYSGYSSNLAASLLQLQLAAVFTVTAQATGTIQVLQSSLRPFVPLARYGILVIENQSGANFHSDDNEQLVVLDPLIDEAQ